MRVLLDECVPRPLKRELPGHHVSTVAEMGWAGRRNGDLISRATGRFDVFLTVDGNLAFQQNLARAQIAVVILSARSNKLEDLAPLMEEVREVLSGVDSGQVVWVGR